MTRHRFSIVVASILALVMTIPTFIVAATSVTAGTSISFPPEGLSLRWYADIFSDAEVMNALATSLLVGALSALFAMAIGFLLALAAQRARWLPTSMITAAVITPTVIPGMVLALGVYIVALRTPLNSTALGLALGHTIPSVAFVFISCLAALTTVEGRVEEAARIAGASETVTLWTVTLPLVFPAILSGGFLAFIGSWNELVMAQLMRGIGFQTLPVLIFGDALGGSDPSTSAIATVVSVFSILLMILGLGFARMSQRRVQKEVMS